MDALPRTSFLTYFRSPNQSRRRTSRNYQRPPPPYSQHCSKSPDLPRIPEDTDANTSGDEELQMECQEGFESDLSDEEEEERKRKSYDALGLFCYTLLVLIVVLNFDLFLSRWNADTGLLTWSDGTHSEAPDHQLHFCLAQPNPEAPTSRVWRYVTPGSDDCTTRTMILHARDIEESELFPEGDVMTGAKEEEASRDQEQGKLIDELAA
ncbi:hypothetical protein N0V90_004754 [Kalmusia sp. IMI 367209]|nr:hypothetical protein N0V90_004754 [Kalmusia sp. IMI 367209]